MANPRAVLDTNVVFEGVTKQGSAAGFVIEAAIAGLFVPCVSDALAYEYIDVLSRKLSARRWSESQIILRAMLERAEFTTIHFSWRPTSPDPGDDMVVDCAVNAGTVIVTANVRDFQRASDNLGLTIVTAAEWLATLVNGEWEG